MCVHELCYGMLDTGTAKDPDFMCHACKAEGSEVEVNVPSRVGGPTFQDLLGDFNGIYSFTLFAHERRRRRGDDVDVDADIVDDDVERKIDFYVASGNFASDFRENEGGNVRGLSLKETAHRIYDDHFSNDAPRRITGLSPSVLTGIESRVFDHAQLSHKIFDDA